MWVEITCRNNEKCRLKCDDMIVYKITCLIGEKVKENMEGFVHIQNLCIHGTCITPEVDDTEHLFSSRHACIRE